MRLIFLLYFLFSFNSGFGQTLTRLFENELPKNLSTEQISTDQLESELERIGEIDPTLYIYFFDYLKKLSKGITDSRKNGKILYKAILSRKSASRDDYIERALEQVSKIQGTPLRILIGGMLEDSKINMAFYTDEDTVKRDDNIKYFFAYKYLTQNAGLRYDTSQNYLTKTNAYLTTIMTAFDDGLNNMSTKEFANIGRYLFLFKNSYIPGFETMDVTPAEYIYRIIEKDYREDRSINFTLYTAPTPFNFGYTNSYVWDSPYLSDPVKRDWDESIDFNSFIQLGVRLQLKKYVDYLSHLVINIMYGVTSKLNENAHYDTKLFSRTFVSAEKSESFSYEFSDTYNKKPFFIGGSVESPLYYLGKDLHLFGGVGLYYISNEYSFDIAYDYRLESGSSQISDRSKKTFEFKNNTIIIAPIIGINWRAFNRFNVEAKYIPGNSVIIGASYGIIF